MISSCLYDLFIEYFEISASNKAFGHESNLAFGGALLNYFSSLLLVILLSDDISFYLIFFKVGALVESEKLTFVLKEDENWPIL